MQAITIKQRTTRLVAVTALTIGLALSAGVAAAAPAHVGFTECEHDGCAIASGSPSVSRSLAHVEPGYAGHSGGPLRPHLVP